MPKVRFETGQVVNFEQTPTQADIDEVAQRLGIQPQAPIQPTPQPQQKIDLPGVATGFGKEVVGGFAVPIARGLQGVGQRIIAGVDPRRTLEDVRRETGFRAFDLRDPKGQALQRQLEPVGPAEKLGARIGFGTTLVGAVGPTVLRTLPRS